MSWNHLALCSLKTTRVSVFLLWAGIITLTLIMTPLLQTTPPALGCYFKSLLIVGLWLGSFPSPYEIQFMQLMWRVCVSAVFHWLVISMYSGHACVNRVKSHGEIVSTFLYMNNIIVNYLWPNLFCYNFPAEWKHMWPVRGRLATAQMLGYWLMRSRFPGVLVAD